MSDHIIWKIWMQIVAIIKYAYQCLNACTHEAQWWRDGDDIKISKTGMSAETVHHSMQFLVRTVCCDVEMVTH